MNAGDDPLRELAEAFGALPAPPPTRELADEDEETRRAVAWMRAALAAQRPMRDGLRELHARRAVARRPFAWRPLAAAAVLLVLLGGPAWLVLRGGGASVDVIAPPPLVRAPVAPPAMALPPAAPPAGLVAVSDHALELRSGPVHLLLVLEPRPASPEDSR